MNWNCICLDHGLQEISPRLCFMEMDVFFITHRETCPKECQGCRVTSKIYGGQKFHGLPTCEMVFVEYALFIDSKFCLLHCYFRSFWWNDYKSVDWWPFWAYAWWMKIKYFASLNKSAHFSLIYVLLFGGRFLAKVPRLIEITQAIFFLVEK